ncbi:TIGR03086 family protein [Amycolatopsis arida]|uniref:TIGR03086 family protein n=1 Tax=Amycolatopsis arida TaxID=587909 RepID=A0A1I5ZP19_9PSEU|nr:TIGR03086 family metal-binding protein [Amycolatopsis arida]TDX89247.1 uncharacterized protein (TIGR03086 family) [Amycolatopsis arida]SFQ58229.1 TIGR03086 family protein [Amycolatopsis arida]
MDLLDAHGRAMRGFDRTIHQVGDHQWAEATPCTDWTVRHLVNHVVSEQLWVPHLLAGEALDDVGDRYAGDVLGGDPAGTWRAAAAAARAAWIEPGALDQRVHLTSGRIDATEYGWQMTVDLAVHGWDLARAIGVPHPIEDAVAAELLDRVAPEVEQWRDAGIVAPPVPVPADADPPDRLVALLGRDPR